MTLDEKIAEARQRYRTDTYPNGVAGNLLDGFDAAVALLKPSAERLQKVREVLEDVVTGDITPLKATNRMRWFVWGDEPLSEQEKELFR